MLWKYLLLKHLDLQNTIFNENILVFTLGDFFSFLPSLFPSFFEFAFVCLLSLHSGPTLCDPMDCSLPGSSVYGILQSRILEWVAVPFSSSVSSVAHWCPTLCDPMNRSTPGLPVHHQLPEFTQTHVHRVDDAIQPSHPLSSPSPPAPNPSQHQSLFQWVNSSHEVAKVLEFQL